MGEEIYVCTINRDAIKVYRLALILYNKVIIFIIHKLRKCT